MDIHKPKPWHGWREFLKEYGIIVLGVLTALGFEQVVEWAHWQERTHRAEARMRVELAGATISAQVHNHFEQCEFDMLAATRDALLKPGDDWRPPFTVSAGSRVVLVSAPVSGWKSEEWRDAQADGTTNHLTDENGVRYGRAYETLAALKGFNEAEHLAMSEINSLAYARRLDPASRTEYLRLISQAEENVRSLAVRSRQYLKSVGALGIKPLPMNDYGDALPTYQSQCDQFHQGKTAIVVFVAPGGR